MNFESFAAMVIERLRLEDVGPVDATSGLYDDLGIDSFQAFELLIVIEAAAGLDVPPPELPELYTLGNAFTYYEFALQLARAPHRPTV
jgi:acyl carrier protein